MGNLGIGEIILILTAVFLIFGPSKLPKIAGKLGKMFNNFIKVKEDLTGSINEVKNEFSKDINDVKGDIDKAYKIKKVKKAGAKSKKNNAQKNIKRQKSFQK